MSVAYINIGSNMGDREALIEQAVGHIELLCGSHASRTLLEESEPWGYSSPNPYLNLGIALPTRLSPERLLDELQGIEHGISSASHRKEDGTYADRLIDIDLIAVDEEVVETERLTLPHPRMHLRDFVLRPMTVLAPEWHHPLFHATPAELLETIEKR